MLSLIEKRVPHRDSLFQNREHARGMKRYASPLLGNAAEQRNNPRCCIFRLPFLFLTYRHNALAIHPATGQRSEEHTSELQSLMRISYAVFCLKKKIIKLTNPN